MRELTRAKFQASIVWTVSNAVADDCVCQKIFLDRHSKLMDLCFAMAFDNEAVKNDVCYLIDNLFASSRLIKNYLFENRARSPFSNNRYSSQHSDNSERPAPQSRFITFLVIFKKFLLDTDFTR